MNPNTAEYVAMMREQRSGRRGVPATTVASLQPRDGAYADNVERALWELTKGGLVSASPYSLELWVLWTARKAYQAGRGDAMMELRTATEVAEELGVHRTTVFRWARDHELGWRVGRDVLFLREHIERMRGLKR